MLDVEKVKAIRERLGLTQEAAARAAGLANRQKWSDIEAGRSDIRLSTLGRVARALGVEPADLLVAGGRPRAGPGATQTATRSHRS